MPNRYSLPTRHHALLRHVTLFALLIAGGSGIAWDVCTRPHMQLSDINEKMGVANDVLLARTVGVRPGEPANVLEATPLDDANASRRFGGETAATNDVVSRN